MAGETVKSEGICLKIFPWSKTSHVVAWFTPEGKVTTLVKGAVRPKSAFLGQYDLNYKCEIVYYARERGDIHILKECSPVDTRDGMRDDWRTLAAADYFRETVSRMAPWGEEAREWFDLLDGALASPKPRDASERLARIVSFETASLALSGLTPDAVRENGAFSLRGERSIAVSDAVAACIKKPFAEKNPKILLDAARVLGVYYSLHADAASETRKRVLEMIYENTGKES